MSVSGIAYLSAHWRARRRSQMTHISRLVGRVVGPVCLLILLGVLLDPMTDLRSVQMNALPYQLVDGRLGATLALILPAILVASVLWLPGAVLVAFRRGPAELVTGYGTILAQALAPCISGTILLLWLAVGEGLFPILGAGTSAHLVLPSLTLGIALLGMLSHTTYLRAARREAAEAHAAETLADDGEGVPSAKAIIYVEIADDWLDTLSRYAGTIIGTLVVVEYVFGYSGVGRLLMNGVMNRDQPVMAAALDRLVMISVLMTALFGLGSAITSMIAELCQQRLTTRRSGRGARMAAWRVTSVDRGVSPAPHQSNRLAVAALAVGGLLLFGLLIVAMAPSANPFAISYRDLLVSPGQNGHLLGT